VPEPRLSVTVKVMTVESPRPSLLGEAVTRPLPPHWLVCASTSPASTKEQENKMHNFFIAFFFRFFQLTYRSRIMRLCVSGDADFGSGTRVYRALFITSPFGFLARAAYLSVLYPMILRSPQ
jgi:hypothetical protein